MLVVTPRIQIPLDEFQFQYARSGGPGGQNVNKVNSKAILRWQLVGSPTLPEDVGPGHIQYAEHLQPSVAGTCGNEP